MIGSLERTSHPPTGPARIGCDPKQEKSPCQRIIRFYSRTESLLSRLVTSCSILEREHAMPAKAKTAANGKSRPVTSKHLAAALAEEHSLTKRQGGELLQNLISLITKHLKRGERIKLTGLGILQVRKRAARMGRNPATGEAIKIKASKKIAFRPAKELKDSV